MVLLVGSVIAHCWEAHEVKEWSPASWAFSLRTRSQGTPQSGAGNSATWMRAKGLGLGLPGGLLLMVVVVVGGDLNSWLQANLPLTGPSQTLSPTAKSRHLQPSSGDP